MLAGIGARNFRNGARSTQITRPMFALRFEQAALLRITAAIIIAIKMRAFFSSRCFHENKLDASDVFACASIHTDRITHINEIRALNRYASLSSDFLRYAGSSIAAYGHFGFDNF